MTATNSMAVPDSKYRLRQAMLAARAKVAARDGGAAAAIAGRVVVVLKDHWVRSPPPVVAAFWPIGDEIDVTTLMARLRAHGAALALPVVVAKGQALIFRRWSFGEPLATGVFGTRSPGADAPELVPDILIVPFLAADPAGNRLGYGAGYYDMTLRELRGRKPVWVLGVGYDLQLVAAVPATERDERLDWVITERRTMVARLAG
jgi:5-formyltetrahydrofolate cyclo-ligase